MSVLNAVRLAELLGQWRSGGGAGERLAATLRALVLDGRVPLEARLPSERELSIRIGVSRSTVTAAYDQLRSEGYITSRLGAGSWVTMPGGHRSADEASVGAGWLDLRIAALPAPALLPDLAGQAVGDLPRWLDHHGYETYGLPPLRAAIAARFVARGLPTTPDQILVTSGALHALDLVIRTLLPRGRPVLAEIPSYPAVLDALRHAGARVHSVPTTAEGWDMDALETLVSSHQPTLAYLIPDFQNPTGALIDQTSRARAMSLLHRAKTYVVIDETFADLSLDTISMPSPMASAHGQLTITIGSLSKSVWGGLRIGWARAESSLIRRLAAARQTTDMASPVLEQLLATRILARIEEILADRRSHLVDRRSALASALEDLLPSWRYTLPAGGLFMWAELPGPISTSLSVLASEHGVALTPGPRFGSPGLLERYLRLPYSLPPEQLEQAVTTIAALAPLTRPGNRKVEDKFNYAA